MPMPSQESEPNRVLKVVRSGKHPTEDELQISRGALQSIDLDERASACEVLLRCFVSDSDRDAAVQATAALCKIASTDEGNYCVNLLIAMISVPLNAYTKYPELVQFAYRSAASSHWAVRSNAMAILGIVGTTGDTKAVELLRNSLGDSNEYVRQNATLYLKKLGERNNI